MPSNRARGGGRNLSRRRPRRARDLACVISIAQAFSDAGCKGNL